MPIQTENGYYATGRRKESTARVWVKEGSGTIVVNGRPLDEYFGRETSKMILNQPLRDPRAGGQGRRDGERRRRRSLRPGRRHPARLSRALCLLNPEFRTAAEEGRLPHPRRPRGGAQEVRPARRPPSVPVQQALEVQGGRRQRRPGRPPGPFAAGRDPFRHVVPARTAGLAWPGARLLGQWNSTRSCQVALRGGATDIHLKAGLPPMFRVDGSLVPLKDGKRLPPEEVARMAFGIMNEYQREKFKNSNEVDLAYGVPGPRPLPRERVPAARHHRRRAPRHPLQGDDHPGPAPPAGARDDRAGGARPHPGHRDHRLGQVHHARGDDRSHQRQRDRPHHDHRGSDRVPHPRQAVDREPARGRRGHRRPSPGAARARCARTRTSSWSAKCATSRPSRPRSPRPRPATS